MQKKNLESDEIGRVSCALSSFEYLLCVMVETCSRHFFFVSLVVSFFCLKGSKQSEIDGSVVVVVVVVVVVIQQLLDKKV